MESWKQSILAHTYSYGHIIPPTERLNWCRIIFVLQTNITDSLELSSAAQDGQCEDIRPLLQTDR